MLSNEAAAKLSEVLLAISRHERDIEVMRQLLAENEAFEPYAAFKRLDSGRKNFVNGGDVYNFLRDHGVDSFNRDDCQCFIQHYDRDGDETLVFGEFLHSILPQDHPILRTLATQRPNYLVEGALSYEVEYTLTRLLEAEVASFVELDEGKSKLERSADFTLRAGFEAVDIDHRGFVDFVNLDQFLRRVGYNPFEEEVITILRRLDRDSDGQLLFDEWCLGLKPFGLSSKTSLRVYSSAAPPPLARSPTKSEQFTDAKYERYLNDIRSGSPQRPKSTTKVTQQANAAKSLTAPRKSSLSRSPIRGGVSERTPEKSIKRSASYVKSSPSKARKSTPDSQRRQEFTRAQYIQRIIKSAHKLQSQSEAQLDRASSPPKREFSSVARVSSPGNYRSSDIDDLAYTRYVNSINLPLKKPFVASPKSIELGNLLRKIIACEREVELGREALISRVDFNITDAFKCFDKNKNGFIGASELEKTLYELGLKPNRDELFLLNKRYDRDHDGRWKFSEFCDAIIPHSTEGAFERRSIGSGRKIQNFNDTFTQETQRLLVRLLNLLIENERQCESIRQQFQKGKVLSTQEAFHLIDLNKDESIDALELRQFLALHGILISDTEVAALLEKFDSGRKGVITYKDFLQELTPKSMRNL